MNGDWGIKQKKNEKKKTKANEAAALECLIISSKKIRDNFVKYLLYINVYVS